MFFEAYFRGLNSKGARNVPHADEAKRDFQAALRLKMEGLIG